MTPDQLKASILQLAIQGKLVPQRPEDGTAEELYQQIQREKKKLTAAGKLKKEKPLPPITEDEIPFDIPDSWKWVRLGELLLKLTDGTHRTPKYCNSGVPFLSVKNISDGRLNFNGSKFISEDEHRELCTRCKPERGDILLSKVGTTGVPAIVVTEIEFSIFVSVALLKFSSQLLHGVYLYYHLRSPLVQQQAKKNTRGVGNKNWVLDAIANTVIALPPRDEQQRIVEKIEQMLPLVEQYGEAYTALESLDARFPDDMRKSILQYAIQGKLVPQRPEEGTAEDLYQQIQKEKKKLFAAGKLKKEKPLPPISEDEIPFDIPDSWKWVHLDNIAQTALGKTLDKFKNTGDYHPYLCSINVYWSGINLSKVKEARFENDELSKYRLVKGDLLICEGGDAGRSAIWESDVEMYYQNALHRVRFYGGISSYFYKYLMEYYGAAGILKAHCKGQTIKHLVQKSLCSMWLPLPSLAEQQRIVKKLEQILAQAK